jgi:hypothetical protein
MSLVVPDTTPIATPWDCAVALTQPRSAGSRAPARARAMPALPARPIDIARAQVDLRALRVASPTGRLPLHRGWRAYDSGPSLQTFNQRSLALDHRPMCGRTVRAAGAVRVPLPRSTIAVSAVHGPAAPSFGLVVPVTPGSSRSPSATRVPRAKSPPVAPLGSVSTGSPAALSRPASRRNARASWGDAQAPLAPVAGNLMDRGIGWTGRIVENPTSALIHISGVTLPHPDSARATVESRNGECERLPNAASDGTGSVVGGVANSGFVPL